MLKSLCTFLFIAAPALAFSQVLSQNGRFSVDFDRGCVPFEVNITELDGFGNVTRQYIYEPGLSETTSQNHVFNQADTFDIVQIISQSTDTLTVIAYDPTETNYTVEKCNLNGISVTSTENTYDFIRVYFTPNDSATLQLGETTSFNYSDNSSQTFQTKGFYNGGDGTCTSFDFTVNPLPALTTPTVNAARVYETCADHFVLVAELDNFDPLISYEVFIEQSGTSTVLLQGAIASNQLVIDGVSYDESTSEFCIHIDAIDNCTNGRATGSEFCQSISELSATPFASLYSSYTANAVFIQLDSLPVGQLDVYRKIGQNGDFEFRSSTQRSINDPIGIPSRQYFYRIDYVDTCGQVQRSAETNPPILESRTLDENSYFVTYQPQINNLTDQFSSIYNLGNESVTTEVISGASFTINLDPTNGTRQFLQAQVDYTDGIQIFSNQLTYKYEPIIHVPTAFTPNGDGLNDTLELFGLPTQEAITRIYNRWGKLIYTSEEPSPGWDGMINGSLAPEATYLYEVIFNDSDGVKVIQKGTFALIKK